MNDYLTLPRKEKIVFIWIRHLRFEFTEYEYIQGYTKIINEIINPMEIMFKQNKYKKIIALCSSAIDWVKFINGNHYHMNLFFVLKDLLNEML